MSETLLVELLTEELPPKALKQLGEAFAAQLRSVLASRHFLGPDSTVGFYATPRRLAVRLTSVLAHSPSRSETKRLMPSKVGFNPDGKPSAALLKRLEKEGYSPGVDIDGIVTRAKEGDTEYAYLAQTISGQSLQVTLESAVEEAIEKLPIPKVMNYQPDGLTTVKFVRPAHGLLAREAGAQPLFCCWLRPPPELSMPAMALRICVSDCRLRSE